MVCVEISGPKKKRNLQHWEDREDDEYLDLNYDDYDEPYNYEEHDDSMDYDDTYDRYL